MFMITAARAAFALTLTACLGGCATNPAVLTHSPQDPYEKFNRGVYKFNDALDRGVAKPVAKGYRAITPQPVRTGIGNFIANLEMPGTLINDVLQGKFRAAWSDTGRFLVNTTIGVAGLFDVATKAGIDHNEEDFGQTLGAWGVPSGPYLVLPLLGPSNFRDAPAKGVDAFTNPSTYANAEAHWGYWTLDKVHKRYELLPLEPTLAKAFDPYAFMRDAYLQNRAYKVSDGKVSDEVLEDPDAQPEAAPTTSQP